MTKQEVTATQHARQRAQERGISVEQMFREVAEAFAAGRRSKSKPRWAWLPDHNASRGGSAQPGTWRYFWNAEESRAYLCVKRATGWRIVTVLVNYDREAAA